MQKFFLIFKHGNCRYGVFEEYGYPGDTKFPMFYFQSQWTVNGQVNEIVPNFCTNKELTNYEMTDYVTGGACLTDPKTGLPDVNCVAVIGGNNSIDSSIMAIPYLENNDQFCDDGEQLFHRRDIPTKHNDMCDEKSVFEVVKMHGDFAGYVDNNGVEDRSVTFEVVRARKASNFVMVLDISGSMDDNCKNKPRPPCEYRIERMKQSAIRWVKYDLKQDVSLGLLKFSTDPVVMKPLTSVIDTNRQEFIDSLDSLVANGGTCLGAALKGGLKVLTDGGIPKGGVMIFLTDGVHSCDGADKSTINEVLSQVVAQNVRVITIAFSDNADPDILKLAQETDGKAYFVPDDSGPEVINTALQGSLTFQPSVPSNEVDIIVYEESFKDASNFSTTFSIDDLLGRNVTVQVDLSGNPGVNINVHTDSEIFNEVTGVFTKEYETLPSGSYNLTINTINGTPFTYASVKVTSKAINDTIPIMTNCWSSIGTEQADLSLNPKVAVIAKVTQGSNPVIGAKVVAYIERDGVDAPIEIPLKDSGSDPDAVANDGLYARYFTTFDPNADMTRYSLKCQVESTVGSKINQGFIDSRRKGRSLPKLPSATSPVCCGSDTLRDDSILEPTGEFKRSSSGGSMEILNADKVNYPPGKVSNFRGGNNIVMPFFTLQFTSSGISLDKGTAYGIRIYYSLNSTDLKPEKATLTSLPFLSVGDVVNDDALVAQEAGTDVEMRVFKKSFPEDKQYYFRYKHNENNSKHLNLPYSYIP